MSRISYILKRLGLMIVTLFFVLTFLFVLFRMMPGDVAAYFLQSGADPETVEQFRESWGLNDPIYIQYMNYLENIILHWEFGESIHYGVPVWDYTKMKIFNTFILVAPAITTAYILGSIFGAIASSSRSQFEKLGLTTAVFLGTIPIFFMGLMAVIIFSLRLGIFPTGSMISSETTRMFSDAPWYRIYFTSDFAMHYILPFSVIALRYSSEPALLMITSVSEVKGQGFMQYQRITGLPRIKRMRHLAKHASLPVITFYPLSMARSIGGLVLIELIFNWPGIGLALVEAVFQRDYPVLQFVFLLVALFIILGNLIIDIIYGYIDPRVSLTD